MAVTQRSKLQFYSTTLHKAHVIGETSYKLKDTGVERPRRDGGPGRGQSAVGPRWALALEKRWYQQNLLK